MEFMRLHYLILLFSVLFAAGLCAHTLHQSTTEAEYNPQTKKLEVSLTVFINDLELALIRQGERELRLDKTPAAEFNAQIQAYLAKTFVVTDAAGKAAKIEWVGRELDDDNAKTGDPAVTLYFEMPLPAGLDGCFLHHAVFDDLFEDQTNLLQLRNTSQKIELRFVGGDATKALYHPKK